MALIFVCVCVNFALFPPDAASQAACQAGLVGAALRPYLNDGHAVSERPLLFIFSSTHASTSLLVRVLTTD